MTVSSRTLKHVLESFVPSVHMLNITAMDRTWAALPAPECKHRAKLTWCVRMAVMAATAAAAGWRRSAM